MSDFCGAQFKIDGDRSHANIVSMPPAIPAAIKSVPTWSRGCRAFCNRSIMRTHPLHGAPRCSRSSPRPTISGLNMRGRARPACAGDAEAKPGRFQRHADLVAKGFPQSLSTPYSTRDNGQRPPAHAQSNTNLAQVNYGYTNVTRRRSTASSRGNIRFFGPVKLVGASVSGQRSLATIVAL